MDRNLAGMVALPSLREAFARSGCLLAVLGSTAALAAAAWSADPPAGNAAGDAASTGRVVITDPWNMPVALNMVPAGTPTLLFVCDPSERMCREGAVYFDSRRGRIKEKKIKPVLVLVGSREAAGEAASRMSLSLPVYVDAGRTVTSKLIGQDITPALILLDGKGNLVKVIPGGGETLDNNISVMLDARPGGHRLAYVILAALVAAGAVLLIAD